LLPLETKNFIDYHLSINNKQFAWGAVNGVIKRIFACLKTLCRIGIGLLVSKTGLDFARGSGAFAFRETDEFTGVFVMIIGLYIVFSSFSHDRSGQDK